MKTTAQFRNRKRFLRWTNGGTQMVQCTALSAPPSNQLTTEQWVRWDGNSTGSDNVIYCQENFIMGKINTSGQFQMAWSPNWNSVGDCPVPIGEWVHLAAVYDGAKQYIYKNGELAWSRSLTGTMVASAHRFKIGGRTTSTATSGSPFGGDIRDVRIWTVARTPEQIKHNMYGIGGNEEGLLHWWLFAEGTGTTASDFKGTKHGTILNVVWEEDRHQPTDFLANAEFIEIDEKKITLSPVRENAIENGDMADGTLPRNEYDSVSRHFFSVVKSPFPNPINSEHVLKYAPTNGIDSELELREKSGYVFPGPGKYTFSVYLWVSTDWDGQEQFMHARIYDDTGTILTTSNGFPTKRGEWERVTLTVNTGTRTPNHFQWYFGYPQHSTKGVVYATGFQMEYGDKVSPFGAQTSTPYAVTTTEIIEDPRPVNDIASSHNPSTTIDGSFQSCTLGRWVGNPDQTNSVNARSIGGSWNAAMHHCPVADYMEVVEVPNALEGTKIFRHFDTAGNWKSFTGAAYLYKKDKWYRNSVYARAPEQARSASALVPHQGSNIGGIRQSFSWSANELSSKQWVRKYVIFQCTESVSGAFYLYGEHGRGILEYGGVMIEEFDTQPVGPPPPLQKGQYLSNDGVIYLIGGEFVEGVEF